MDGREKLRFISVCLSLPFFLTSGHLVFAVPMRSAKSLVTILCTILLQPIDHGNFWHLHLTSNRQLQSFVTFICTPLICIQLTNEVGNLHWQAVWLLTVMKTALPFLQNLHHLITFSNFLYKCMTLYICLCMSACYHGRSSQTIYIWALHHQISFSLKLHPECKFNDHFMLHHLLFALHSPASRIPSCMPVFPLLNLFHSFLCCSMELTHVSMPNANPVIFDILSFPTLRYFAYPPALHLPL